MKASTVPSKLPMRGSRKANKLIKLAQEIDRPEYFQRLINSLTQTQSENNDGQSCEEDTEQQVVTQEVRKESNKGKRRKPIKGGLLD